MKKIINTLLGQHLIKPGNLTMNEGIKLLLVDDDIELCDRLVDLLEIEGFTTSAVHDGEAGVTAALSGSFDLVLLEVTMPILNGFEALKAIRKESFIPIIMLTARSSDADRIYGLEFGADDYLPKPYNHRELVARIKAILRRVQSAHLERLTSIIQLDDIKLNLSNHEATIDDKYIEFTPTEFQILKSLIEKAGELIPRDDLTQIALNRCLSAYDRAIDMHVSNIRKKIGPRKDGQPRIKTVRGTGYYYILP